MPVPVWPGFGLYPGSVKTIAIVGMLPEIVGPDFVMELLTITVINEGTLAGGPELLPGLLVHAPPQIAGLGLVELVKPLKPLGPGPPLSELKFAHRALQNVT